MLMMIHAVIGWIAIYPSQMIYPCEGLNCLGINPPLTLITCSNSCSADSSLSAHLKDVLTDEFSDINGRFHTRGRTNRLVWHIVSDEQIIVWWANGTNKFFDEQTVWYLAVWKDDFSKTICLSRRTSRRQYDINSHQTDKFQTICPSRRFIRPPVWIRPFILTPDLDFNNLSFSVRRSTRFVLNR